MKIMKTWKENEPSSVWGYSVTVSTTYLSYNPEEIEEIKKKLQNGTIVTDADNEENSTKKFKAGDEAYLWFPKLPGANDPVKVKLLTDVSENGKCYVTDNPDDKDAWLIVNNNQLYTKEELISNYIKEKLK